MDERARRIGTNEAVFRQVNEEIEGLERVYAAIADDTLHIVCECGDLACTDRLPVMVPAYEAVRQDPTLFFVVPGHETPDVEDVVEAAETYNVVRKHDGGPAAVAQATDPRS
jgi:hypothetical protein